MAGARDYKAWKSWLWLMVATICVHALLPVGSPLARTNGSPFSAATIDVSTAPSRKWVVQVDAASEDGSLDAGNGTGGLANAAASAATEIGEIARPGDSYDRSIDLPARSDLRLAEARAPPIF